MNWKVLDSHSSIRIDDGVIGKFKKWFESYGGDVEVMLSHCDPLFWMSQEERDKLGGPVGAYGCVGPCGEPSSAPVMSDLAAAIDRRPVAEAARVIVNISFSLPGVLSRLLTKHKLRLTSNKSGDTLPSWNMYPKCKYIIYQCGLYKKPGFDKAFAAMKELKPTLTELEFCKDGDDRDLVTEDIFHGTEDCITQYSTGIEYETETTCVTLRLLAPDVETNFEYITSLLASIISK